MAGELAWLAFMGMSNRYGSHLRHRHEYLEVRPRYYAGDYYWTWRF